MSELIFPWLHHYKALWIYFNNHCQHYRYDNPINAKVVIRNEPVNKFRCTLTWISVLITENSMLFSSRNSLTSSATSGGTKMSAVRFLKGRLQNLTSASSSNDSNWSSSVSVLGRTRNSWKFLYDTRVCTSGSGVRAVP